MDSDRMDIPGGAYPGAQGGAKYPGGAANPGEAYPGRSEMIEVRGNRTRGTRYPAEVKELAYEVYAKRADSDIPRTMAILAELVDPPLSEKTVYEWRQAYQWDKRLELEKQAMAPVLWERYTRELSVAAPEAVSYLLSIVRNVGESTRDRTTAARSLMQQYASHAEALLAALPPAQQQVSSDISNEELLALVTKGRDAEGEEEEG
jgi:hypothetical protein